MPDMVKREKGVLLDLSGPQFFLNTKPRWSSWLDGLWKNRKTCTLFVPGKKKGLRCSP